MLIGQLIVDLLIMSLAFICFDMLHDYLNAKENDPKDENVEEEKKL
jgi:hypothetical protein